MESAETILEPGVFDCNPQAAEALLEQLLIRQLFPRIFPPWHRPPEVMKTRYPDVVIGCHRQQPPSLRGLPLRRRERLRGRHVHPPAEAGRLDRNLRARLR